MDARFSNCWRTVSCLLYKHLRAWVLDDVAYVPCLLPRVCYVWVAPPPALVPLIRWSVRKKGSEGLWLSALGLLFMTSASTVKVLRKHCCLSPGVSSMCAYMHATKRCGLLRVRTADVQHTARSPLPSIFKRWMLGENCWSVQAHSCDCPLSTSSTRLKTAIFHMLKFAY